MYPILFKSGSFELRSFGVLMMLAFLLGSILASRRAPRFGIKPASIQDATLGIVIAGVIGARLAYLGLNWNTEFAANPSSALTLKFDGLTSFGALILGGLVAFWYCKSKKIDVLSFLDTMALPVLIAHALGRVGCFLNGCCYGHQVSGSPPGVHFHDMKGLYLPAQLYDAAMVLVGAVGLYFLEKTRRARGFSIGAMMVIYGLSRYIYEFWRIGASSKMWGSLPFSQAQAMAALMMIVGLILIVKSRNQLVINYINSDELAAD